MHYLASSDAIAQISVVGAFASVFVACYFVLRRGRNLFWKFMRDVNAKNGTAFPTDPSQLHLVLSGGGTGQALVFDEKNKKIFLVTSPTRMKGEILDYSYIKSWALNYVTRSFRGNLTYQDVHFEFGTNDIKRPRIRIPLRSLEQGHEWNLRLNVIFSC